MEYRAISPQYFQTMRIPILQGRGFEETDTASTTPVAIVSETVARAWWKGENPIGDRIVVGEYGGRQFPEVLEPAPRGGRRGGRCKEPGDRRGRANHRLCARLAAFQSSAPRRGWFAPTETWLSARRSAEPSTAVNPDQRVLDVQSMSDIVARAVARPTFNALLMGIFAALALVLTSVGIYGVLSFHVARRTQEIGIRIALGARRANVLRMVVAQGAFLVTVGIGIGLAGALALSRFLSSLLSGVSPPIRRHSSLFR